MKPYTAIAVAVAVIAAFAFGAATFGQTDSQAIASGQEVRQLRAIAKELRTLNTSVRTLNATVGPKYEHLYDGPQPVTTQLREIQRNTCKLADPNRLTC
jgi:uncharacterized protein HemX